MKLTLATNKKHKKLVITLFGILRYMDDVLGQGAEILQSLQVNILFNKSFESKILTP